jgi:hypothetical protein
MRTMDVEEKKPTKLSVDDASSPAQSSTEVESKQAFLSSFTQAENKAIMRKVDRRFLLLIGILYMTKNVRIQRMP